MDLVDKIIAYEAGELSNNKILELFSELVKTGKAWTYQDRYSRMAKLLIKNGYLNKEGRILKRF